MKFKRLLAAILSALMITSCFSFVASAQETQTVNDPIAAAESVKAKSGTYRNTAALTKTMMYDAVDDTIFYRLTPNTYVDKGTHLDCYSLNSNNGITVTNNVAYLAIDMRTNYAIKPSITIYNSKTSTGGNANNTVCTAETAVAGNGEWERVVIAVTAENLSFFSQNHIYIFGRDYTKGTTVPADMYIDVSAFAYFNDEYSAKNYDFADDVFAAGEATFSVDGVETTEVPTENPTSDGAKFVGWSAEDNAASGAMSVTALETVPAADGTTYYAIFVAEDAVEDAKAVYVNATSGDDANSGRHSAFPVKTLDQAKTLLAGEGIDTLYVIGAGQLTTGATTLGIEGKTIKVRGYNGNSDVFDLSAGHLRHTGPVDYDNITISLQSGDGKFMAQGHDITIGSDVTTVNGKISQFYYGASGTSPVHGASASDPADSTLTFGSGSWSDLHVGNWTDASFYGTSTVVVDGATVGTVKLGHGSGTNQKFNGTANVILESGTIGAVNFDSSTTNAVNSYAGLRYITLNGGTVTGNMTITSKDASGDAKLSSTATGVTVVEINAPEILAGSIKQGAADDADVSRVVIYNNDSYVEGQVTDAKAIVLNVAGGTVSADVTVADDYTATLNGFTYDLDYNYYNTVKIGETEYDLADYETLPASLFAAGVNTVEFFEAESDPITTVYVSDNGDDANKGDTAEAPLKTMAAVRALIDAEGSVVDTVYIVGTVTVAASDATTSRPSISIGAADGRKIKYLGYGDNAILDAHLMPVYLVSEVEIDNFMFQQQTTWDGKFMAEGNDLTIGENMTFAGHTTNPDPFTYGGTTTVLTNFYYALKGNSSGSIPTPLVNTLTVNGGKINSLQPAIYSGDATFKGEVTLNLNKNAEATTVRLGGQGYSNTINTYGTIIVNVNDNAKIGTVESEVGSNSIGNYSGLREININGGNVGTIKTTGKASSAKGTATKREQLMVVTVNGGTLGAITKPVDDADEKSQIVVIFNDGVAPVAYNDSEAYILNVTGGKVAANTTVSEDYTTATLNKFTFTTTFDAVRIGGTEYKVADLNGEISLDKLTKGTVNEIQFLPAGEAAHVAAYRAQGYEILYVASSAKGTGDGSTAANATAHNNDVAKAIASGEKGVVVLVDQITVVSFNVNAGATVVITENDDNGIFYFEGSVTFGNRTSASTAPSNIIFDNVHILHKNGSAGGERILNIGGNNLTFTNTVTNESSSYPGQGPLNIHAGIDGTSLITNSTGEINITLNGGSRLSVRAGGYGGSRVEADVNYTFGGTAHVSTLYCGGHSVSPNLTDAAGKTQTGDVSVVVKDNATVGTILASNAGIIDGNIAIDIQGGKVAKITPATAAASAYVSGNIAINVSGGTLVEIAARNATVKGTVTADIDLDNATLTGTVDASVDYAIAHKGNGTYAVNVVDGVKTLALTPGEGVQYIRVTNGDTVKEYNVAGDEVTLMADLSALALGTGLTTVEFLNDGTEAPTTATLKFYDGDTLFVEKTVDIGATDDVLPVWSDVGLENAYANDTFARPSKEGYYLVGWAPADSTEVLVAGEFAATEDASYYAVWEEADMIGEDEVTITLVSDKANSPIPEDATGYYNTFVDGTRTGPFAVNYNADGTECVAINAGAAVPGLVKSVAGQSGTTTTSSYYGSSGANTTSVIFPDGAESIWYKWNDGKYLGVETPITGEVNVAYVINASPSATTKRGFYLEAGDVAGTLNLAEVKTGTADFVVSFKTTLEEGDIIKYAGPADFDNSAVKAGQLLGIYVWADAPAVTTADYTIETYTMDTDGAYGAPVTETKKADIGSTATIDPESKTGFIIDADASVLSGTVTAEGLTLKVYYIRDQYTLYTKADAEAEAVSAGIYYYEAAVTAPADPEKDGYTFKGWDIEVPATMPANDVTLTATWEQNAPATANAIFDANGGAWGEETTKTVETTVGETPVAPTEKPVYEGFVFDGWDAELTAITAEGATYKAVWVPVLTPDEVLIVEAPTDETGIPAGATYILANSVTVDSDGNELNVTNAGNYGSTKKYFDAKEDANANIAVWYKNSGYIPYYTGLEAGTYNVTFRLHLKANAAGVRGFDADIDGKKVGAVQVSGTTSSETDGIYTSETFVTFKDVELSENALIKYAEPAGFDNNTIKGGDLLGIYIWTDAPAVTTANAVFDANGGAWADGATTKTVETTIGETPVAPEEAPTKADYTFAGWEPALAAITADGATYTAKWTATPRVFGDNVVYVSNAGDDENDGLTPEKAVKTLTAAAALLAADKDNLDTIVVVGTYEKKYEAAANIEKFGNAYGKKITITGYDVESMFDMRYYNAAGSAIDSHLRIGTDVEINNIKLYGSSKDGGIMSQGYELTIGENVTLAGGTQNVGFVHYNAQYKDNGVVNLMSGSYNKVDLAVQSGQTWKGTATLNIGGTASTKITNGHGWQGTQAVYGINNVNINGGNVSSISLSSTADTAVTNYAGLRYFTINAGTVGNIATTGSSVSKKYTPSGGTETYKSATDRAGVTVFEINGGTVGTIALGTNKQTGEADADDATRVVILNNGMTATVTDTGAIVVKATGAKLHAATNAEETYPESYTSIGADWGKAVALTGFTYELAEDSEANAVKVDGGEAVLLADLTDGLITGITTAGEHTVEFVYVAPAVVNNMVYVGNDGDDTADGLTADTAVKTLAKAHEIIAADENIDTIVIVGTYTTAADLEQLGVAGRTLTVTGADENAVFDYDANKSGTDDDLVLVSPIIFKNIAIRDGSGDGVMQLRGNKVVFDEGVTANSSQYIEVAGWSGSPNNIHIKSGEYGRILPGAVSGSYTGTTNIVVDGGNIKTAIVMGHGWRGQAYFTGTVNAVINDGNVASITMNSNGDSAAVAYRGLRYFTLNGGTVGSITTTEGSQYKNNGNNGADRQNVAVSYREGVTVFEINKAGIVTGTIALGNNVVTNQPEADNATRIILFNNGSYEEGKVTDTGAITVDVQNGAIKADVTVGADGYTTTLNGYTFTTDKAYVTINGVQYAVSEFVAEAALAADEVSGVISTNYFVAGNNTVVFSDAPIVKVTWEVDGEIVQTDEVEVGTALTAPAAAKTPDKNYYYTFKAWNDGTTDIADIAAYTAPEGGAALVAVFDEIEMPASATYEYTTAAAPNYVADFSVEVATIDGVEAIKITPNAGVTETSIRVEGWDKWPLNKSYPGSEKYVNTAIYPYVVVRYYYVPGTLEGATTGFWANSNNTFDGNNGTSADAEKVPAEAGKWTYVVYDLSATAMANKVSRQYWVRALAGATLGDMNAAGAHIYLDNLAIYKDAPTVATVTFKGEDGSVLYAIDALNSEAVAYNGAAVEKDDYTFLGWAVEGTDTVVDAFTFAEDTVLVPVFEEEIAPATIKVEWFVDGVSVQMEEVVAGVAAAVPTSPEKDGFTFKGWAIEGTTETLTEFVFTVDTNLVAVFEENQVVPANTAVYKTYGVYDEAAGTYTIEVKLSGVVAHMGSFGFAIPGAKTVTANTAAGISLFAEEQAAGAVVSPIFVNDDNYYANTWAVEAAPGYIDATEEEILIATIVIEADGGMATLEEYVVENADAKYHNGTNYLAAPKMDSLETDKVAIVYAGHEDKVIEAPEAVYEYKTYGTYNGADETYTIDVTFKGGKINAGAFGIAFNSDYMTYDPEAEGAFELAEGIANYLGLTPANTADGIAFAWDGSADAENGYVDATDAEVIIATIKVTMTAEQRAAYVEAGKPMFELLDISNAEDSDKLFNGTDYLVSVYADDLKVERAAAQYTAHADDEIVIENADVTVKVTYAGKAGATTVNLGYLTIGDDESIVIDAEGNTEETVEYVIKDAKVGEAISIAVAKNGYIGANTSYTVNASENVIEFTLVAGDIKEATEAISGNGEVELSDFIRIVRAFDEAATEDYKATVDINEDGAANVSDLAVIKANFGKTSDDVAILINGEAR